jgi:hypothetical protein
LPQLLHLLGPATAEAIAKTHPANLEKMGCMERLDQLSALLAFRF